MHLTPQLYVIRVSGHKYRVDWAFKERYAASLSSPTKALSAFTLVASLW